MDEDSKIDVIASKFLGKKIEGINEYSPQLLVAVPRIENRLKYGIDQENLPFSGWDIWHCYEFSVLTNKGFPVTRLLKLKYSCQSDYIVESKSLKLYLNSFNMSKFGDSAEECLKISKGLIEKDLSNVLKTNVEINFLTNTSEKYCIFEDFTNLSALVDADSIDICEFKESPDLLKIELESNIMNPHYIMFDSLRSNCRVTHQPDFGDVFIFYESNKLLDCVSLIKYLVSFRCEYHFHEECVEMIYKRLSDILNKEDKLLVCALYTRRGGIDISPVRYSCNLEFDDIDKLVDLSVFARFGVKQ